MALDRNQVPAERKWRVEDIFESVEAWNALYAECEGELDFSEFEGKLNTVESVLSCMEKLNALVLKLNKLAIYAHIRHDEDSRVSEFTALNSCFFLIPAPAEPTPVDPADLGAPQTFSKAGITLHLTDKFKEEQSERGFDAYYTTDYCGVVVLKEPFTLEEGLAERPLEQYIKNVIENNGSCCCCS